jgi:NitT/TauT family transport system ATP-binding protein
MSARPGRVRTTFAVALARPRLPAIRREPAFVSLVEDLWDSLKPEWQERRTDDA